MCLVGANLRDRRSLGCVCESKHVTEVYDVTVVVPDSALDTCFPSVCDHRENPKLDSCGSRFRMFENRRDAIARQFSKNVPLRVGR